METPSQAGVERSFEISERCGATCAQQAKWREWTVVGAEGESRCQVVGATGGSDEAPGQGEYPWGTEEGKP